MLDALKQAVGRAREELHANLTLSRGALISAFDRDQKTILVSPAHRGGEVVAIGPVDEAFETPQLPAHRVLYLAHHEIGAIIHTHSHYATCWAQARLHIPCLGTLHADYFCGEIPVTRALTEVEVEGAYAFHLGKIIAGHIRADAPFACPAILVAGDGPFVWGRSVEEAVEHALALEEVARLAFHTLLLNREAMALEDYTQERHFHGPPAFHRDAS
jgi:L-ribulose-5-phosphate 4-epimerase